MPQSHTVSDLKISKTGFMSQNSPRGVDSVDSSDIMVGYNPHPPIDMGKVTV
jgi:hypothetical protein